MPLFQIQGNIGAGKTTVMEALQDLFGEDGMGQQTPPLFIFEDVEKWSPYLEKFYMNPKSSAAVSLQLAVLAHYQEATQQILEALQEDPERIVFVERGPNAVRDIFLPRNQANHGAIENFFGIMEAVFFDPFSEEGILWAEEARNVYLRVSPEVCFARVQKRNRESEGGAGMTLGLLQELHRLHNKAFLVSDDNEDERNFDLVDPDGTMSPRELAKRIVELAMRIQEGERRALAASDQYYMGDFQDDLIEDPLEGPLESHFGASAYSMVDLLSEYGFD